EDHFLYLLRFWHQSQVLACIRIDESCKKLIGTPYGDRLFVLHESGRLASYRYVPSPGDGVTEISGNQLRIRFRCVGAKRVSLAGTFNGWNPSTIPLRTE